MIEETILTGDYNHDISMLSAHIEELRGKINRELSEVKKLHDINLNNGNEKERNHWSGRIMALKFALSLIDESPSLSLQDRDNRIRDEAIDDCLDAYRDSPDDHYSIVEAIRNLKGGNEK